ncbi:NAD-dependent DNA ligase LigA [Fusobacterium canifelinum]|uniref:NAD-dependent DNA ligase LigA n=1 Tax=Fusobacterium canifelinum TaxID=285729 RepID=UPI0030D0B93B
MEIKKRIEELKNNHTGLTLYSSQELNDLEKIVKLREDLDKYRDSYYNDNKSLISDYEFDILLKELESLEEKYPQYKETSSPTTSVGASLKENKFKKVEHAHPMLSLANSYNIGEIVDFIERIKKKIPKEQELKYCLEVKLDGLSISLTYRQGKLVRAVTRGDGLIGEDVTENILEIASIVKTLPQAIDMEIRGEVVLPLASFEKLNNERLEKGEELFANPRNAASGTLRQLDSKIVKERGLDAYFYFLVEADKLGLKSHSESIKFLESMGIKTTKIFELFDIHSNYHNIIKSGNIKFLTFNGVGDIEKRIDYWEKERENLPYETDGLVIKVDEINLWNEIGYTSKAPRWAIAYKFPALQISTVLNDVTWQVGRTGKLTPVALFKEVELAGSKVERASLHNISEIQKKDIRIGDRVFIKKAAEIIPQVVKAIKEERTGNEKVIEEPTHCPVCGHKLEREEGLVDIKCINEECPGKNQAEIEYFVSKDALNIMGLGSKIVEKFIDLGYIKTVVDIFDLKNHRESLENIDKMGERSIENLLNSIEESKNRGYDKVICSLGMPLIGKVASKALAKASKNIGKLMAMTFEELTSIDGIGKKAANEIIAFFNKEKNQKIIQGLKEKGLKFEIKESETNVQNVNPNFAGKNFLFTGTLKHFTREQIKEEIEKLGGKNLSSVSKNLDYLIVGEKAGSKLKKAQEIPTIKILTEEEFIELKDKFD